MASNSYVTGLIHVSFPSSFSNSCVSPAPGKSRGMNERWICSVRSLRRRRMKRARTTQTMRRMPSVNPTARPIAVLVGRPPLLLLLPPSPAWSGSLTWEPPPVLEELEPELGFRAPPAPLDGIEPPTVPVPGGSELSGRTSSGSKEREFGSEVVVGLGLGASWRWR
jgi:hypothetical protein